MKKHTPKYIFVFLLTLGIFASAWFLSSLINTRKFANLKAAQDKLSIGILSSETEFDLLKDDTCDASAASVFATDLASLAGKIAYSEQHTIAPEKIITLKQQYSLLQVRDFLLTKRVAERCKQIPSAIFYFYGTKEDCAECTRQGYVLDALRESQPEVRIYAFDYNLDLSTIKALISIYDVKGSLPALVINGTTFQGFQSLEQIRSVLPKQTPKPALNK